MVKTCAYCAKPFIALRSNQKFCSDRCRIYFCHGARKVPRKARCPICETIFTTIKDNQKYCSHTCHDIANNSKQMKKKVCAACGKEFWSSTDRREYCSKECAVQAKRERDTGRIR